MKRKIIKWMTPFFGMATFNCGVALAEFESPLKQNLVAEYLFSGSSLDTSGYAGQAQVQGGYSYGTDAANNLSYLQLTGTGQFGAVLPWSGDASSSFSVSFWTRTNSTNRINPALSYWGPDVCPSGYNLYQDGAMAAVMQYGTYKYSISTSEMSGKGCYGGSTYKLSIAGYTRTNLPGLPSGFTYTHKKDIGSNDAVYYTYTGVTIDARPQVLFTTKKITGSLSTDLGLRLTRNHVCEFEGGNSFDCSFMKDNGWHHFVIARDYYGTLNVYVDGAVKSYYRTNGFTVGKVVSIGKGTAYGDENGLTYYPGDISGFRIWNKDLSPADIITLSNEHASSLPLNDHPAIDINYNVSRLPSVMEITASTNTGTLHYSVTAGETCDGSLSFEPYSPLVFSSMSDNGLRICFKSIAESKTTYRLSSVISGIIGTSNLANPEGFFQGGIHKSWSASPRIKSTDFNFYLLGDMAARYNSNSINFVDINGDGLVDVLGKRPTNPDTTAYYQGGEYRYIMLNNGNLSYGIGYKCYQDFPGKMYYGDCADMSYYGR